MKRQRTMQLVLGLVSLTALVACDDDSSPSNGGARDAGGGTGGARDGGSVVAGTGGTTAGGGASGGNAVDAAVTSGDAGTAGAGGGTVDGGAAGAGGTGGGAGGTGGDAGSSGDCPAFVACGGDPVGEWKMGKACGIQATDEPIDGCPGGTSRIVDVSLQGSISIRADGTYSSAKGNVIVVEQVTYPAACLTSNNVTLTCTQLAALTQGAGAPGVQNATCSNRAGGGCDCKVTFKLMSDASMGTWSRSGNVLTTTEAGGDPESSDYCVQGNRLLIRSVPSMQMDVQTGHFVFTK